MVAQRLRAAAKRSVSRPSFLPHLVAVARVARLVRKVARDRRRFVALRHAALFGALAPALDERHAKVAVARAAAARLAVPTHHFLHTSGGGGATHHGGAARAGAGNRYEERR